MENKNLLIAYHESARVVFAYLNGYACDTLELPVGGAATNSKLNAANDGVFVQAVLSGKPSSLENREYSIEVAKKLMSIYCAGTCAEIYYQNNFKVPSKLEMDISGQDMVIIEKIQSYLTKATVDHPDDFPSQTIVSVFKRFKEPQVWKAIEMLATKALQESTLKRFFIEDTLMVAGLEIRKPNTKSGFGLGVYEEDSVKAPSQESKSNDYELTDQSPLDIMVKDFLKKLKSDWQEDNLNLAVEHLHKIYKKYGQ